MWKIFFCGLIGAGWLVWQGCVAASKPAALDENFAIAAANGFLKQVIRGDYAAAYQFVSPGAKFTFQMRFEQFSADLAAIREKFGPIQKAEFEGYRPVAGRRVLQLYYRVRHAKAGEMLYHLLLEAGVKNNFTLFLLDVGDSQPFPDARATPAPMLKKSEAIVVTGS